MKIDGSVSMSYKVIDGFSSEEEAIAKINDLVGLGYDEKEITIMTKKENKDHLKRNTAANIETTAEDTDKGMLDKLKDTFSDSDTDNPLGKYDLEEHIQKQYTPIVNEGGYVLLVEENTSFTMGRESETNLPTEKITLTSGETGDFNETPGGINPLIPGTGVDAKEMTRNPGDVRTSDNGGTNVQDNLSRSTVKEEEKQSEEVTKANKELNDQPLTGKPVEPNIPGYGIDPNIPPQSTETRASEDDLVQPQDLDKTKEQRRELQKEYDERTHL